MPSIIYGILGLAFIVRGPLDLGFILAAGSLTLALLVLPMVIIAAREAIRAVPDSIRQGSLALGATKWQTIRTPGPARLDPGNRDRRHPRRLPGARRDRAAAAGRGDGLRHLRPDPFGSDGYSAMPVQIFNYALRPQEEFQALAAAGIIVMLVVLLAMNSFAIWLRNRYEQRW